MIPRPRMSERSNVSFPNHGDGLVLHLVLLPLIATPLNKKGTIIAKSSREHAHLKSREQAICPRSAEEPSCLFMCVGMWESSKRKATVPDRLVIRVLWTMRRGGENKARMTWDKQRDEEEGPGNLWPRASSCHHLWQLAAKLEQYCL